jgi:hypothetical protein
MMVAQGRGWSSVSREAPERLENGRAAARERGPASGPRLEMGRVGVGMTPTYRRSQSNGAPEASVLLESYEDQVWGKEPRRQQVWGKEPRRQQVWGKEPHRQQGGASAPHGSAAGATSSEVGDGHIDDDSDRARAGRARS